MSGGAFAALLRDVEDLRDRVIKLANVQQAGEVASVIERAQKAVAAARDCLDELNDMVEPPREMDGGAVVVRNKSGAKDKKKDNVKRARVTRVAGEREEEEAAQRASQRVKKKSKKVVEMEANDESEDEEHDEQEAQEQEEKKRRGVNLKAVMKAKPAEKPPRLLDGMIGKVQSDGGESLVYFSLAFGEKAGLFDCPSMVREEEDEEEEEGAVVLTGTVLVKRSAISALHFGDLAPREQRWYQGQLEADLLKRFEINFPVLFANQGCDMLSIKLDLLHDPTQTEDLIGRLAQEVDAAKTVSNASPNLRAANNSALMVASMLHKTLKEGGERGWHEKYRDLVQDMCSRCDLAQCDLKPSSIEQYRKVGELMLRCNVVACLLPSFVKMVEDAVEALLDDEEAARRLEDAFKGKLNTYFKELSGSSVLHLVGGNHKRVLELAGATIEGMPSLLEEQVQNLLLESQNDGSLLLPMAEDASGSSGKRTSRASKRRK